MFSTVSARLQELYFRYCTPVWSEGRNGNLTVQRLGTAKEPETPPTSPYWTCLDTLVDDRGRVAAAEALGVNYRTVARCQQSRRVSRRMRQVLQDTCDDAADIGAGDTVGDDAEETVEYGSAALELENRTLREMVQAQAEEMEC